RAAVELLRRHELVAGLQQAMEHQNLRRMAGRDREPRGAAFERGDQLLEHGIGRIADARIDVAEGLQPEQGSGVIDAFEYVRRRLIDRRRTRAGGRIGLRAGVNGERGKAGNAFAHRPVLMLRNDDFPFIGRRKAVKSRQAAGAENATAALVGAAATETFSANKACGSVQRAAVFGWKRAIATRQAGEMRARLENRQAPTRSRSGMN